MASLNINSPARPLEWICLRVGARSSTKAPFSACFRKAATYTTTCSITTPDRKVANKPPWLMLPPSMNGAELVYDFYRLDDGKVVSFNKRCAFDRESAELPDDEADFVGSSHGWIVCHNTYCDGDKAGKMFLSNPISHRHIKLPSTLNLPLDDDDEPPLHVENVVISSPDPDDINCRAVMISFRGKLAFCCPRLSSNWTPFGNNKFTYQSVVYSTRQKLFFCATDYDDGIQAWDLTNLNSPPVMIPINDLKPQERFSESKPSTSTCLVVAENSDDLYQVRRFTDTGMAPDGSHGRIIGFPRRLRLWAAFPYKTTHFDVYKYDKGSGEWEYVDRCGLDGMALFVGRNHGFALSSKDHPDLRPDSVYFTDVKSFPDFEDVGGGHDIGIFDYRNKTISPCYFPCDYHSIKKVLPPPFWFTPNYDPCYDNIDAQL